MKFIKGSFLLLIFGLIWFASDVVTDLHLFNLEQKGVVAFGPLPDNSPENYIFNRESTILLNNYPVDRISDLTKDNFEAIILKTLSKDDQANLKIHLSKILKVSEEYQIDPFWMLSIVMVESRFLNDAKSFKNAHGLMQIQPETANHIYQMMNKIVPESKLSENLFDVDENLDMGAFYLKKLLQNFHLNFRNATIAYNLGPNKLKSLLLDKNIVLEENDYFENVSKNYRKFVFQFQKELNFVNPFIDRSYVVRDHGQKIEYMIFKNIGLLEINPNSSENLARIAR